MNVLDYVIPFVALAQAIGRWGNFFNVEAYGYETDIFLRMGIFTSDGYIEVHPTFLYESICTILIFFILKKIQKNSIFCLTKLNCRIIINNNYEIIVVLEVL